MTRARLFILRLAVSMLLSSAGATAGRTEQHEGWAHQCLGGEAADTVICTTEIPVPQDGREYLVYFVHSEADNLPLVVAGEEEAFARATITVDDNDPVVTEDCEAGACYFAEETAQTLLEQFRKGGSALVRVTAADAGIFIDRKITLRGFVKALGQAAASR